MGTLVIAHITFCVPYVFIIVKGRIASMDPHLEEAARDLGASPSRVLRDIILPLAAPAILAGMLLAFAMSLDDVIISFFVTGPGAQTLPLKIFSSLKVGVTPEINALCTVMLLVVFLFVGVSQWLRVKYARDK
jgi:spermidine/putrescine transport system permease protein